MSTVRCLLLAATLCAPHTEAAEFVIDPSHTYVSFEVDHLGFSTQRGLFTRSSGRIAYDAAAGAGSIDIRIDTASLDTGFALRDEVLRGESWFNVAAFPDALYRSSRFVFADGQPVAVEGTLMLLGEIRPLRLEIERFKCGFNLLLRRSGCGADAGGVIRRSAFGMGAGVPFVGDEVRLRIQVEAYPP